jgi:hypothetical protein
LVRYGKVRQGEARLITEPKVIHQRDDEARYPVIPAGAEEEG